MHTVEPPQAVTLDPVVVKCHNDSYDISVTWGSQGNADGSQVSYEYQLLGSTESEFESEILQKNSTMATVVNITNIVLYNYTHIIFSITAHNCAGSANETTGIIQVQGEDFMINFVNNIIAIV